MPFSNSFSIAEFVIGILGLLFAIYQTWSMKKLKDACKDKDRTRYKTISGLVVQLTENQSDACQLVNRICVTKNNQCSMLSAKVETGMVLAGSLVDFCDRLNDDFISEFRSDADVATSERLKQLPCIDVISKRRQG